MTYLYIFYNILKRTWRQIPLLNSCQIIWSNGGFSEEFSYGILYLENKQCINTSAKQMNTLKDGSGREYNFYALFL